MRKIVLLTVFALYLSSFCFANTYYGDKYPFLNDIFLKRGNNIENVKIKRFRVFRIKYFFDFVSDSVLRAQSNIDYPKRAINCLLHQDIYSLKEETKRFCINSTFGLFMVLRQI